MQLFTIYGILKILLQFCWLFSFDYNTILPISSFQIFKFSFQVLHLKFFFPLIIFVIYNLMLLIRGRRSAFV